MTGSIKITKEKEMKKIILIVMCSLFLVSVVYAEVKPGTPKEAQQMVKKAVTYIKANGKEKGFAAIYDFNGKCLAHGFNSALIGKDLIAIKDSDGKLYVKERVDMAKKNSSFWLDYKFPNPTTKKIEPKSMYAEVLDDLIIGCGVYNQR
jgi:signal transduction histidine kinase